ncbi:Xaa-Pro peptidase family protein [Dehalobacter sp. DCM]|uniref:M24 family metallopeptidase n=1 Tax=Dehalobacter sp. DCM TaxID=2907827 RepID=UPI0030815851|nr:Xaa-Pro peptidase family protein [Dehalobacter sp. DCM]
MLTKINVTELNHRLNAFCGIMDSTYPDWDTGLIINRVNQYYFTGTMQDGLLVIKKDRTGYYFARRSYERAKDESLFLNIYPMESYRDAVKVIGAECGNTYLELEVVPVAMLERLKKYFSMPSIRGLDQEISLTRAVKSPYELERMINSGKLHKEILTNIVPSLLTEGMSEADLVVDLYAHMVKIGHHGVSRFAMFQNEIVCGQIGFGESSLYPTNFDGPGGAYGMSPAVPVLGSRERKLKKGDLVFVDIGFGVDGYHTDKTQVYQFGAKPSPDVIAAHRGCIEVENRLAEQLMPGAIPSVIYALVMNSLSTQFLQNFMGYGKRQVKFLGHGIGLNVDELPVIANGFDLPLQQNMVIALEPKKGIQNVGMVGVEDTYTVTPNGGNCLTGGGSDIIIV